MSGPLDLVVLIPRRSFSTPFMSYKELILVVWPSSWCQVVAGRRHV